MLPLAASVLMLGLSVVESASADSSTVTVQDNSFTPQRTAVRPGEAVTFTQPAFSNSAHNVVFEDGQFSTEPRSAPWTATRTFASAATYLYYCQIHGGPGGSGMSGVVYVNPAGALGPVAAFTASPNPVLTGQTVTFSASGSTATNASIVKYEWDLDANGSFETDTASTPTTSRSYANPATLSIKLRVTDSNGVSHETPRLLQINAPPPPIARFSVSPNPSFTGQTVTFDATASTATSGSIAKYEWDLDANGSFETDTGTTPMSSRSYASPATLSVKLRVTDTNGTTNETTRSLQINAAPEPVAPPITDAQPQPQPQPVSQPPVRRCVVPSLRAKTVADARKALAKAGCSLGKIRRARGTPRRARTRVSSQTHKKGTALPAGTKIDVTVKAVRLRR